MLGGIPDPQALRRAREAEGYYELGLFEEALERAEDLLADGLLADFARNMRAECLRSIERYEEGVRAYEEIVGEDPANVAAWVGLGWCRKRTGRLDLAVEAMERLLEEKPGEGIGLYNLACYCSLAGRRERALRLLAQAIRTDETFRTLAREEPDFAPLEDDPEFHRLTR